MCIRDSSGTVYDNIRYGRLEATREAIEAAAMAANAHRFIVDDLAEGYETCLLYTSRCV